MFCCNCGNKLPEGAKFCGKCGANLSAYNNDTNTLHDTMSNINYQNKSTEKKAPKESFHLSKKSIVIISSVIGGLLILALIAFVLYSVIIKPSEDHNNLVSRYKSAYTVALHQKEDLQKKIGGAEYTVTNISKDSVADSSLFSKLNDEISNAKSLYSSTEIKDNQPDDDNELLNSIENFNKNRDLLKEEWNKLNDADVAIYRSRDSKVDASSQLIDRLDYTNKDNQGYEIQTKIKTTPWIKATNTNQINKAWTNAGGKNSAPDISTFNSSSGYQDYSKETCCVLIGSVEFHNKTPNFHISKTNKKDPAVYVHIYDPSFSSYRSNSPYSDSMFQFKWKTNYWTYSIPDDKTSSIQDKTSSGCLSFDCGNACTSSYNNNDDKIVTPEMTEDSWGPVAFMIVMHNEFSPNYPNGNPLIDNLKISFTPNIMYGAKNDYYAEKSFLPGKTW